MRRILWSSFDCSQLADIKPVPRQKGNPGGTKHKPAYLPIIATFDTETSTIQLPSKSDPKILEPHAFVYVWMFYLPHIDTLVYGRTIEDYAGFIALLSDYLQGVLLCFVHNLSFDWTFCSGVYEFGKDGKSDVFSIKPRKILQATMGKVEHRCSALLSNQSLKGFLKSMQVEHQKLSGDEFDYTVIRYPWTPIKDTPDPGKEHSEWDYCTADVVGLAEAVQKRMDMSGKDIYHFPFTSTGFVRSELRRAVRHISDGTFKENQPSYEVYKALRRAFRGGDTHANRKIVGEPNPPGYSYDRSSSYPDVQCNHLFPSTPFKPVKDLSIENILERSAKYKKAILMVVRFNNIRLRYKNWGFPYIPADRLHTELPKPREEEIDVVYKGRNGRTYHKKQIVKVSDVEYDNGRILSSPWADMIITDVDLHIIIREYDYDSIEVYQAWESRYGIIPQSFTDLVKYYYAQKTELKGNDDQIVKYNLTKALVNSIYGCTAQDVIKADLKYNAKIHDWEEALFNKETGEYEELIDKTALEAITDPDERYEAYKKAKEAANEKIFKAKISSAWLPYQLAVWTTAWARWELHEGLWNVYDQGGLPMYCDTDSVKYLGDNVRWDKLNERLRKASEKSGAYATDIKGKVHYMGVWEKEGSASHSFERFATLGAKKYCYEALEYDKDDKEYPKNMMKLVLHTTIAAVTKKGAAELAEAFGPYGLDRFAMCRYDQNEFTFVKAGGSALIYNDDDDIDLEIDGHQLHIGRNVVITDDTYTLSLQEDYSAIIRGARNLDLGIDD